MYCHLLIASALALCISAHAQNTTAKAVSGNILVDPSRLTLTEHFETRGGTGAFELAVRHLGDQLNVKRAADAARSPLDPFWQASFWKYIPITFTGMQHNADDPFFTPVYLTVPRRQIERAAAISEKRGCFSLATE